MSQNKVSEDEISLYQDLLELEIQKFQGSQKRDFNSALLTDSEIRSIISKYSNGQEIFKKLMEKKMIYKYGEKYRTAHMDLLAKIAFVRPFIHYNPLPLEFDIYLDWEAYPDFGAYGVDNLLKEIDIKLERDGLAENQRKIILDIIKELLEKINIKGLSNFQGDILRSILVERYRYIPLVAPTATGKTLTFMIPALVYVLEAILKGEPPVNVLLVYPRKALAKDQAEKLIEYLAIVNEGLAKRGINRRITIAIDDGDTPRKLNDGDKYRGLKCSCQNERSGGKQDYDLIYSNGVIRCSGCNKVYDFIVPTKDAIRNSPPNVLITNLWTLYRRLLNKSTVLNYKNLKYIVFDEIHAYTGVLYFHLRYILRLLFSLKKLTKEPEIEKIVFSSATIPNYREFLSKLACCGNEGCIPAEIKTYNEFYGDEKKTEKRRLILIEYLMPNVDRDVETLTVFAVETVLAWLKDHGFKGILFADSVSGVSTFYKYFVNTILGDRQGKEVRDHLCYKSELDLYKIDNYEYYWPYLKNYRDACSSKEALKKLAEDLKNGIGLHYASLSQAERAEIEQKFKLPSSDKFMLFSTSTLELGIDIGDVAVVVQHKLPLSKESFIQRIGRAGRGNGTYRIATGIVVLQATPFASMYMYNKDLRQKLIEMAYQPIIAGLDALNPQIALQHVFSYLLMKRAIAGKSTCVDDGLSREECEELVEEVINEAQEALNSRDVVNELCIYNDILIEEIRKLLDGIKEKISGNDTPNGECSEFVESELSRLQQLIDDINDLQEWLSEQKDNDSIMKILGEDDLENKIQKFKEIVEQIFNLIQHGAKDRNEYLKHKDAIADMHKIINDLLSKLKKKKEEVKKINANNSKIKLLIQMINITNDIRQLERKTENILNGVESLLEFLQVHIIHDEILRCIIEYGRFRRKRANRGQDEQPDIFSLLSERGSVFMDLLMTPPSPAIEAISVESDEIE